MTLKGAMWKPSIDKRIFFCARGPVDQESVWATLWNEEHARMYLEKTLEALGLSEHVFNKIRVESHYGYDSDSYLYVWGDENPSVDFADLTTHKGHRVWIDGVEVYNDLVREPSDEDHDPDCEDCAKVQPT